MVGPHLLAYNDTWDKIDTMLRDAMSPSFRNKSLDSFGGGWVYNWFCVDHVDYDINPRRRDIGYHNVYDHYRAIAKETKSSQPFNRTAPIRHHLRSGGFDGNISLRG